MKNPNRYCPKFCEHHPHKAFGYFPYVCVDGNEEYAVMQEHSRGRPFIRRKDCPELRDKKV